MKCGWRDQEENHLGYLGSASTGLPFNINVQSGLKLHSEVVLPDDDSLKPALYQGLIEGFQVCGLQFDEILQLVDTGNLCIPGSSELAPFRAVCSLVVSPPISTVIPLILLPAIAHLLSAKWV